MSLYAPEPPGVRPIGARALKSLTDTLRPLLQGARVLDLFAGQGRVGLCFLEHGAAEVIFVEQSRKVAALLDTQISKKRVAAQVVVADAQKALSRFAPGEFGIVFADPPFPLWDPDFECDLFLGVKRLAPERWVIKYPSRLPLPAGHGFRERKNVPFGESRLLYYDPA